MHAHILVHLIYTYINRVCYASSIVLINTQFLNRQFQNVLFIIQANVAHINVKVRIYIEYSTRYVIYKHYSSKYATRAKKWISLLQRAADMAGLQSFDFFIVSSYGPRHMSIFKSSVFWNCQIKNREMHMSLIKNTGKSGFCPWYIS